jgi:uncharacterized protein YgbK (DUF1537 family)
MRESNLVDVLRAQTAQLPVRGIDVLGLRDGTRSEHPGVVVVDGLEDDDLGRAADLVLRRGAPAFAVGSGGLSMGLARRLARAPAELAPVAPVAAVLAVSGSCAPQTAEQVRRAIAAGWEPILAPSAAADPRGAVERALAALAAGRSVVVHGAPAGRASAARDAGAAGPDLDAILARFVAAALDVTPVRRFVLAGGDTAGGVLRHLGAETAELAGLAGGLPVCRLSSKRPELDGVEVLLKGGQVGGPDVLERARRP